MTSRSNVWLTGYCAIQPAGWICSQPEIDHLWVSFGSLRELFTALKRPRADRMATNHYFIR
jgi:hypothetical protein